MNKRIVDKVESLKALLISRATGVIGDDSDYKKLRLELSSLPNAQKLLAQPW